MRVSGVRHTTGKLRHRLRRPTLELDDDRSAYDLRSSLRTGSGQVAILPQLFAFAVDDDAGASQACPE